jgi:hypothetical protein
VARKRIIRTDRTKFIPTGLVTVLISSFLFEMCDLENHRHASIQNSKLPKSRVFGKLPPKQLGRGELKTPVFLELRLQVLLHCRQDCSRSLKVQGPGSIPMRDVVQKMVAPGNRVRLMPSLYKYC